MIRCSKNWSARIVWLVLVLSITQVALGTLKYGIREDLTVLNSLILVEAAILASHPVLPLRRSCTTSEPRGTGMWRKVTWIP